MMLGDGIVTRALTALLLLSACGDDDGAPMDAGADTSIADAGVDAFVPPPPVIGGVEEVRRFTIPNLGAAAHVVYTESAVPHVYAEDRLDLARVSGFVVGRDRFFEMDMARRLSQGTLSALLGQDALFVDQESRATGTTAVVAALEARLTDDQRALFAAYAEGVNAYIQACRDRRASPPQEFMLASTLFGVSAVDLMEDFAVRDIAAVAVSVTYQLGYETTDLGRARGLAQLEGHFEGAPLETERSAGLLDAFFRVTNSNGYTSATRWGLATGDDLPHTFERPSVIDVRFRPALGSALERMVEHAERLQLRLGRTHDEGFGSNAWAASGAITADGSAILAADGHLPGTVPTLFYRIGMDTQLLGDDAAATRQVGLVFPGVPTLAVGTNGQVAWNQTQFFGDITDWYADELVLDADGAPSATVFDGAERPLQVVEEDFVIADRPSLGSVGRTESILRYATFDGRLITSIEGREVTGPDDALDGETAVNLMGDWIVPADEDDDGVIRAISFDYTALDGPNFGLTLEDWGHAATVEEMRSSATALVAYSQNVVAADATGSVAYLPYQVMPCRQHLPRDGDGRWAEGAHPNFLIDGTRFGGFELPLTAEGRVDEAAGTEPHRCVVPLDEYPATIDPAQGFVVSANNDPGEMTRDNDLQNDPWYIGGPWHEDFRAARIDTMLRAESGSIDEDAMARMQSDVRSPLGELLTPLLLEALDAARAASEGTPAPDSREARLAALWEPRMNGLRDRIAAWRDGGFLAESGVETFYHPDVDDAERANAIATTIFNAWLGPFDQRVFGDEAFPSNTFTPTGSGGRMRVLTRLVQGRGAGNPLGLASYADVIEESAFFDVQETPEIENAVEIAMLAFVDALAFLASEPTGDGADGGFGSDDPATWLWGLRHTTRFDALIADFLEGDDTFGVLADSFSITTETLPLADAFEDGDPRAVLDGFPRPGDNFVVDAANSGFSGQRFRFGSIPVFRMVVALRGDDTTGRNVLPGGQSGDPRRDTFSDQAALWLANQTTPMHLTPEAVAAAGTHREVFLP